jgi:LPXTG-site transpeptidase (sortase) family protein
MPLRRPAAIAFAAGLVVIVGGTAGLLLTHHSTPALRPVAAGVAVLPAPSGPIVAPPQSAAAQVARPVSLTIPLIGVKSNLITLGLAAGGAMQVPSTSTVAGWFTGSPRPGAVGSSIIVGHVDSKSGPGIFFRLPELKKGDDVYVKRSDGTTAEFRVTEVQEYPKNHFPTETVFGPTPDAELRLITCGGTFDSVTGHYLSNIIVYANQIR